MKINLASYGLNTDTGKRLLAKALAEYPYLQVVEFSQDPFSFQTFPVKPPIGGDSSARAINDPATKYNYAPASGGGTQKAYSKEYEIDIAYKNDLNVGLTPDGLKRQLEAEQLRLFLKVVTDVIYDMFNGDGITTALLGFNNFIKDVADASGQTAIYGFTQDQIHSALKPVNMTLDLSNRVQLRLFEELLTSNLAEIGGSPILTMNTSMFGRMTSMAKELNVLGTITSDFGKPISTFGNTPMLPVSTDLMPNNETDGENTDLTSIYAIGFDDVTGVRYATNTGFAFQDFDIVQDTPAGKTRVDFIGNLKIEDMKKIRRFSRIKL